MDKISISYGNKKMGAIPSVSLPPVVTCAPGCTCAKKCYAAKLCRIYPTVKAAYNRNLNILNNNSDDYWIQVQHVAAANRFFRYHVSGDIPNIAYLINMDTTARLYPKTEFLVFTKKYNLINDYIEAEGLPENLHVIFSEWPGMDMYNPYKLPVAHVVFKGCEPAWNWKPCSGNCLDCAINGSGCWTLKSGEHIYFNEH